MSGCSVLVVGSRGFLASYLIKLLAETRATLNLCSSERHEIPDGVNWFPVSRLTEVKQSYDVVFLLSAKIPYGAMNLYNRELIETNIGLTSLVSKQFPASRLVFSSSVAVYGKSDYQPIDEAHPHMQASAYGLSKLAAETIIRCQQQFAILRFSSLYGADMREKTFMPLAIRQALSKGSIEVFGDGKRLQNYLHVSDAANLLLEAATHRDNYLCNATADSSISNTDLATLISEQIDWSQVEYIGEDNSASYVYSNKSADISSA